MQLPVVRKTPTGQPSTAEDVLEELAENYPLPKLILEHRNLSKLKSTYTDKLPEQINAKTGRVHTSYHQAVAATGRLSSQDPEPAEHPDPHARRAGASARRSSRPQGHVLLAADYSQIELRIMAHLSGDEGLLKAFASDQDIHQATAAEVFGTPLDQVTRRPAPLGEGDQLRPHLRHERVRPRRAARHPARHGAGIHRPVFRALSRA